MEKRIIALSINNTANYNLISNILKSEGYQIETLTVHNTVDILKKVDIVIVDETANSNFFSYFEDIKNLAAPFIPILFILSENSTFKPELNKSYSDIIRMPINKTEFLLRINTFIKLHIQSEQIIKNSEQKYRAVFETTGTATMIIDEDTTILLANNECELIFGYSSDKLIGESWTKFIYKEDLDIMIKRHFARRKDNNFGNEKYETHIIASNGEIKNIILSIKMIPNTMQSVVSMLDVTERKKVEKELKKLTVAINNSPAIVVITDLGSNIEYVNPKFTKVTGYTYEEVLGKNPRILKSGEQPKKFYKEMWEKLSSNQEWKGQFHNRKKNGELIWEFAQIAPVFDTNGKKINYIKIAEDITERKQAEMIQKTLLNISSSMNSVEKIQDFYYKVRHYLGNVIDTTNFIIALYDKKKDTLSLPFNTDKNDEYNFFPAGKSIIKYVIETGEPLFATEEVINDLSGKGLIEIIGSPTKIWMGVPLKIKKDIIGVIAVQSFNDPNLYTEKDIEILSFVSEEIALTIQHKKAEEEIKKNLNEKEMLLRELYHRTKNNMQVISSILRIKARDIKDKNLLSSFQEIEMKIRSMALVHQKLYESQNLSSLNLRSYFNDLILLIRRSFVSQSSKVNIYLDAPEDIPILIDTAIPLGLVLNELLTNSIKYAFPSNSKGEIHVALDRDADKKLIIEVSDNGVGYKKFDVDKDTNLGLKTVISLIEKQLGGKISFDFKHGFTTKIEITKEVYNVRI